MANDRADEWASWEVDPSTRTSVHAFTKYAPITATLSTTASDVFTVDRGMPSVNMVRNPSIELNALTEFTATGSAISQSNAQAATGTYSLLVNPTNAAKDEGVYYTTPSLVGHPEGSVLTASVEVRGASASGTVKLSIQDSAGVELLASAPHSLTTGFVRLSLQHPITRPPATYRVAVVTVAQHNINFYVDKIHVELRKDSSITDYVDGAQGVNYEWIGTAHASESKRRAGMSVIRGLRLKNTHASIDVYVALDQTASATVGFKIGPGEVFETTWPVDFRTKISAVAASGTPAVHGVVWGIHQG